ncbi:Telomerase reverse transcriptase [Yarrowia sp. C11]|nr:Telomerase reverse transcriptase [Yarrowia sp. E02]KAG5369462.1 Telomerase reverse transcriptase [Yarrowia sp. C11]
MPDYVDHLTYPAFIRQLSSFSSRDSVLHTHVRGVFDPSEKRPYDDQNSSHTAIEALCETGWRKLAACIGRYEFAKLILGNMVFMKLKRDVYFQVSGPRIDDVLKCRPVPKPVAIPGLLLLKAPPAKLGQKVPRKNVLLCKQIIYYCMGKTGYHLNIRELVDCKDLKIENEHVLLTIFPYTFVPTFRNKRVPKRLLSFEDIASNIVKKCQNRNFLRLLEKWFPLEGDYPTGHDLNDVVSFCVAASHLVFPHNLLGSAENWAVLRTKYVYYLNLPSRTPPHLDTMTEGFKLTQISWLFTSDMNLKKSRDDMLKARELFDQLIIWITNRFLPHLLRSFFYFTDSLTSEQIIYRHAVWQKKIKSCVRELKKTQFSSSVHTASELGISKFRLVPKPSGFRPIVSLGRPVFAVNGKKTVSVNKKLSKLYKVLNQEFRLGGLNRCGLDSVHLLKRVLTKYEEDIGQCENREKLKFVKIDVTAAFDTIPASKVKDIAKRLLACSQYTLHNHSRVLPLSSKSVLRWFTTTRACDGRAEGALQAFKRLGNKGLVVDDNKSETVGKQTLYRLLNDHLFRNDVLIDGQVHRQVRGIPQGSVMSSLFCAMVYEEMVLEKFSDLVDRQDTCLMRYVDDFLLITTDTETATEFLKRALKGLPDYGVSVNRKKCLVNFPLTLGGAPIAQLGPGEMMPFLGMKIDPANLQIHRDYPFSSTLLWVDKGVELKAVKLRALEYFSARFPRFLLRKTVPEEVVMKNVIRYFRYVFLRALRTLKHFDRVSESRMELETATIGAQMIDIAMSLVARNCPQLEQKKLRGWLTKVAVVTIEKRR